MWACDRIGDGQVMKARCNFPPSRASGLVARGDSRNAQSNGCNLSPVSTSTVDTVITKMYSHVSKDVMYPYDAHMTHGYTSDPTRFYSLSRSHFTLHSAR